MKKNISKLSNNEARKTSGGILFYGKAQFPHENNYFEYTKNVFVRSYPNQTLAIEQFGIVSGPIVAFSITKSGNTFSKRIGLRSLYVLTLSPVSGTTSLEIRHLG